MNAPELVFQLREASAAVSRTSAALEAAARACENDLVRRALDQCIADARLIQKRTGNIAKFCGVRG